MIDFELNRKRRQSLGYKLLYVLGGLFFISTGIIILLRDNIIYDWYYIITAIYFLVGLGWVLHGLNILNVRSIYSVKIDDKRLFFNSSLFDKSISFLWSEVVGIEIKVTKLLIGLKSGDNREIELGWVPYNDLIVIKNEVEKLAGEKGVNCKRT